jgi:uncharacterized protein
MTATTDAERVPVRLVDCDVHPTPRSPEEFREHMPEPWRSRGVPDTRLAMTVRAPYSNPGPGTARRGDAEPPGKGPACSDPDFTAQQLFGDAGVDLAMLLPLSIRGMTNPEHEQALCSGLNNWLGATWLDEYNRYQRFYGALRVCAERPDLAVAEIERWAGHPYFKLVMLGPYTMGPLGQPQYHPIYEAAARHGLAVGIHVNRWMAMHNLSPVGFQSYFLEHQVTYPFVYLPHLVSFLAEGVFEKYPDLRLSMIEGGFTWAPPILWRLDNLWEEFHEMPLLSRKPSEHVREHVRFTTQPMDEPASKSELTLALDAIDAEHTLMFSTDYPHYDFDDPPRILQKLPQPLRPRVAYLNALEWYSLPPERPTGPGDVMAADRRVLVASA